MPRHKKYRLKGIYMHTQPYKYYLFISEFVIHSKHVDANIVSNIHLLNTPIPFRFVLEQMSLK